LDTITPSEKTIIASPRRPRWQKFEPLAMGALSGVLLTMAYPPLRWDWLAWGALVPLYLVTVRGRVGASAIAGWAFGFLLFLVGANWMTELGDNPAAKMLPWVVLSLIQSTPFLTLAAVLALLLPRLPAWARPLTFAAFWTGQEWVRAFGDYSFPWFILAATQVKVAYLRQIVELTGQWGLSFFLAFGNGCIGEIFLADSQHRKGRAAAAAISVPVLVGTIGTFSMLRVVAFESNQMSDGTNPVVGIAQGSYVKPSSYNVDAREEALNLYLNLTRDAVSQGGPKTAVVLWPETVVPDDLLRSAVSLPQLQELSRSLDISLLVGTPDENEQREQFNTAVLIDRSGNVADRYDKRRLVPIGEFFPLRGPLASFYEQYGVPPYDHSRGTKVGLFSVSSKLPEASGFAESKAGVIICYESAFVEGTREAVQAGANWIALITSDLTFGTTSGPIQHADLAILRAVETRRWVVRAAATGTSQFISPTGEVVASLPLMERGVLTHYVTLRRDQTLFVRWGDWFLYVVGVITVGALFIALRGRTPSPAVPANASAESSPS
jgi:apolipoprotein N-acyltransferase